MKKTKFGQELLKAANEALAVERIEKYKKLGNKVLLELEMLRLTSKGNENRTVEAMKKIALIPELKAKIEAYAEIIKDLEELKDALH